MSKKVVILGAGITGLACAWKLAESGFEVEIIEKEPRVGGLASSVNFNGYIFDFGPHAFHTQDENLLRIFKDIVGEENIITQKKWVKIKFRNRYYDYPLRTQDVLLKLNPYVAFRCLLDFLSVSLRNKIKEPIEVSSKDWLINRFGRRIYNIFFAAYTERVWGVSADNLSLSFIANRLPTINLGDIIYKLVFKREKKFVQHSPHEVPLDLTIYYPKNGSIVFPHSFLEKIEQYKGLINLNSSLKKVYFKNGRAEGITFIKEGRCQDLQCDYLISTIPIYELVNSFNSDCDRQLSNAAGSLRFRSIILCCFVVKKDKVFLPQTIYFTNRIFNRLAQMNSYSPDIFPAGKTGLIAELTCDKNDKIWNAPDDKLLRLVIDDIEKEGFATDDDIETRFILKVPYGYPILEVGYEDRLKLLKEYFSKIDNLLTGGRQGAFNYIQMNFAFMSGLKMAEYVILGKTKKELDCSIFDLRYYF